MCPFYNAQLLENTGTAKGVFTHSQSSCHIAKVVLALRHDSRKSPSRLTRPLTTPPALSRRRRFNRRQVSASFSFSFFVRSESRFFVPTRTSLALARAEAVKVGRHTDLTTGSAVARPHLDSFKHDGTLGAIRMTIGGEPACGRDQSRHNLVSGGSKDPNHDAVMRIGSEAPKRRTHSPFRH
jgi:hypothetical protein